MNAKKDLSHDAYGGVKGQDYLPYVSENEAMKEVTCTSILFGCLFAVIFGAANTYLGLKVGMTIAAGLPSAILATGILKGIFGRNNILESNLIQAMASMGESLAGGLIFIIPAVIILGKKLTIPMTMFIAILGGFLGILFVVPLRKYLIVEQHGVLLYPEGMAASEVLVSGSAGGKGLKTMLTGLSVGGGYKLLSGGFKFWIEEPSWVIKPFQSTIFGVDTLSSLLGVGFIVGKDIAQLMFAGALIGWFGLIPLIKYFGSGLAIPIFPSAQVINKMDAWAIWNNYIRYIGAGTVAAGGFISIAKTMPTIINSFKSALGGLGKEDANQKRTDKDVPITWVIFVAVLVFFLAWFVPMAGVKMGPLASILAVLFAFFFAVVSARLVGIIGTSNNPISGMTIATLLFITAILKFTGKIGTIGMIASILAASIVSVSTAVAGGTAQGLKTTFVLGGTPEKIEKGMMIAVVIASISVGGTILLLNSAYGIGSKAVPAPQANLMAMIAKGIVESKLPWALVIIGITFGVMCELMHIPVLPVALGIYLPIHLSAGVLVGGIVRSLVDRKFKNNEELLKAQSQKGVLLSSGLVAGDALVGILIAIFAIAKLDVGFGAKIMPSVSESPWASAVMMIILCIFVYKYSCKIDKTEIEK